jgi:hypothetical protein
MINPCNYYSVKPKDNSDVHNGTVSRHQHECEGAIIASSKNIGACLSERDIIGKSVKVDVEDCAELLAEPAVRPVCSRV